MIRLVRYLKPYLSVILLTIVLLFVQANADLALPDYLSRIVNNGIQQGGVENAVPTALRASTMDHLQLFLTPDEQSRVMAAYTLVDASSPDYAETLKTAPGAADESVYVLTNTSEVEIAWLNPVMAKALLAVSGVEQVMADPDKATQMGAAAGFDLSRLPPGADLFTLLGNLPQSQREQLSAQLQGQFAALGESAVQQAAIQAIKAEFTALGMNAASLQTNYILSTGLLMLLVTLVSVASSIAVGYLSARTAAGLSRDLRRAVFQKVEGFSSTEFDRFSTASLITRTTNDITQIQMVVIMMMRMVFYAPIMGVGGIIRAIDKDSSMWWIIAVGVAALLSLIVVVFSVTLPKFKAMQNLIDRLNLVLRENLSGMMVIRAFNMQPFEEQRFDKANQDLTGTTLFINRVMVAMFPTMMFIMNGLSLLIIWIGSQQVAAAQMQVGDMMAFMQYAMQIVFSFLMMSFMFILLPRASVSGGRIAEVLGTEPTIRDAETPRNFPAPFKGAVEFRNVSFRYPGADEDVLHDINFTARPGQTTAFIGSTGSGKSTVVNLIPRFYDVTGGQILIDGVDIRQVTQHELRDKIGYIPQKSTLFSGTIESNLRYADDGATKEALLAAAGTAQVTEFIDSSADGLATEIAQGGANVSGGQKQRLSIARALVKQAPIYIFDDSFSALDFKTDAGLRHALKENTADSAVLIVTQRVSTVMNAEQIVVLDEGQVVGIGTHPELMKTCEPYREIALSQLSMEELS
ncbi:MAG TPA: ABC transporter [Anaerolineaceae bacterium]|nr:MAG: ABC transporter [Chloroflexi bacterium GWB2_54_36]HAL15921.1 ABC transporter [Anaerolineaceae bacterium]